MPAESRAKDAVGWHKCRCGHCDVPYDTVPTYLHGRYSSRKNLRVRQKLDIELGHLSHKCADRGSVSVRW